MPLTSSERETLTHAPHPLLVIGLCAAWCGTCREFEETFAILRARHRHALLIWLDIEDDSALAGDIDVENFPSLAVFRGATPVFFGVTVPTLGVVERLILALADAPPQPVPEEVSALYRALTGVVDAP